MTSVRGLFDAEIQQRREKGLCFRCDKKYHFGRRCANSELQVLIVWEEELEEEGEVDLEELEDQGEFLTEKSAARVLSGGLLELNSRFDRTKDHEGEGKGISA